jgi:hypothetical protein
MDLFKSVGDFIGSRQREKDAKQEAARAERERKAALEASNWEPAYASEQAPTFQTAKSPVARAYLESFLTGANADAVQGTRAGSEFAKKDAGATFNREFGGWDKLHDEQRAIDADTERFAVKPIEREVMPTDQRSEAARFANQVGGDTDKIEAMLAQGFTEDDLALMKEYEGWAMFQGIDTSNPRAVLEFAKREEAKK